MKLLRFLVRLPLVLTWILFGLLCVSIVYPLVRPGWRGRVTRVWSRWLMRWCGIQTRVLGQPCCQGAVLWVANHVSWIDIFVLNSVRATAFIAKRELRAWPVLGWLVAGAGTIFIERGKRHAVSLAGRAMQGRFDRGEAVGLFPEGTTSEGFAARPFHANLFEPARLAAVPVQPVALRFLWQGRRSGYAAFVGEETFAANLWRVLSARGLAVEAVFLPPLRAHRADGTLPSRLELSHQARDAIAAQL